MKLKDFTFLFTLIALALFDALFGGALAAILQHEGWKQRINDLWQVGFGVICFLTLSFIFFGSFEVVAMILKWACSKHLRKAPKWLYNKWLYNVSIPLQDARWQAIYLLAMLLAYSEDLLFYPILWVLNDIGVTNLISDGFDYTFPAYLWPWSLSGWFGFVTRLAFGETIKLPTIWAMVSTVGTLAGILWHMQFRKDKQR